MSGRLNSFSILALFGDETARDILQEVVNNPDIKLDFFSGKSSEPLSTILSAENYDLIFLDKSIESGINIDVIEIDAASHRGIDDVRAIKESVKLAPAESQYKVFIIDEAHMLTTEASNALLKTLEEPPNHVMFILATTNPEKLISTIRSRTTIVNFKKATKD